MSALNRDGVEIERVAPVDDMVQEECPVSTCLRFPEMVNTVAEVIHMNQMREATGATPYGSDTRKWPAKWVDAVRAAELESWRIDAAKAEMKALLRNA